MATEISDEPRVVGRVSNEGRQLAAERGLSQEKFRAAETDEERDAALGKIEEVSIRINEVLARDCID